MIAPLLIGGGDLILDLVGLWVRLMPGGWFRVASVPAILRLCGMITFVVDYQITKILISKF